MKMDRRTMLKGFLAGTGLVTVGLPALEIFAQDSGFPTRFGLFFWGNGMIPDRWVPAATGADWALSDQLAPLSAVKQHITVVSGLSVKVPNIIPHHSTAAGVLTGSPLFADERNNETFQGPSLDQVIAAKIGADTQYRSVEFGAAPGSGLSHTGPHQRNPPESSPIAMFERLFGPGFRAPGDTGEVDPTLALRRSVLDAVGADAARLRTKLGAADKVRLEQHLEGVRDLERRLARLQEDPPNLAACLAPMRPMDNYPDIEGRPQLKAKNRAMCDIIALALACDQTRVFSNWFTSMLTNVLFPNAVAGHHQLTHDEPGDQPGVHDIVLHIMEEFAYLVQALAAVPEGDETLLDHCVVLATSEISLGRNHSPDDIPVLLAGSANGRLKSGIHYRSPGADNISKLPLTLLRAVGVPAAEFGTEQGLVTDGIGEIEA
jgi:hypothetical protein